MGFKASVVMIYIGMMMLLLCVPNNHDAKEPRWQEHGEMREQRHRAKMTEYSPAPQPQPPGNSSMYGATPGSLKPQECAPRCTHRCSKTAFKKPCMFFCQKCCATCLCVPPGTYGNKQYCPCYNTWKTKRGGPKCP